MTTTYWGLIKIKEFGYRLIQVYIVTDRGYTTVEMMWDITGEELTEEEYNVQVHLGENEYKPLTDYAMLEIIPTREWMKRHLTFD